MEKTVLMLDLEKVDATVQIHGTCGQTFAEYATHQSADYEGVSMSDRNADSKKASSELTEIFRDYYPELLVRSAAYGLLETTKSLFHSTRNSSSMSPLSSRGSSGPSNQSSPQPPLPRCLSSDGAKVPSRVLSCLSSTSSRFQSDTVVTRLTWSKHLDNSFFHSSYPIVGDICLAGSL